MVVIRQMIAVAVTSCTLSTSPSLSQILLPTLPYR